MTWQRGQREVEDLLTEGTLEPVSGAAADGTSLLASADSLLAQQGLATKSSGDHVTTELVVRAQFGGPFDAFALLSRRRSEIEYPRHPATRDRR